MKNEESIKKIFGNRKEIRLSESQKMDYELFEVLIGWYLDSVNDGVVIGDNEIVEVIPDFDTDYITITTEFNRMEIPKLTFRRL